MGTGKLTENRLYAMDFKPVAPVTSQVNAAVCSPDERIPRAWNYGTDGWLMSTSRK